MLWSEHKVSLRVAIRCPSWHVGTSINSGDSKHNLLNAKKKPTHLRRLFTIQLIGFEYTILTTNAVSCAQVCTNSNRCLSFRNLIYLDWGD